MFGYILNIICITLIITFFFIWFTMGWQGLIIGLMCIVIPLCFMAKRLLKHIKEGEKKLKKIAIQGIFTVFIMLFLTIFILDTLDSIKIAKIQKEEKEELYRAITSSDYEKQEERDNSYNYSEAVNSDAPYVGMDARYIDKTKWGTADEEKVFDDTTGVNELQLDSRHKIVNYYWYNCQDDMQFTKSVEVFNGSVSSVNDNTRGIETSEIDAAFRKCPK